MPQLSEEQIVQIKKFVETFPEEEREAKLEEVLSQFVTDDKKPQQQMQCPFCLMNEGKLKVQKVFEDKDFLAVLEINPANPGHVLVFPRTHVRDMNSLAENLPTFLLLTNSIASSLLSFNSGVNILFSMGSLAGQKFDHMVVHIIPRKEKDEVVFSWKSKPLQEKDLVVLREKIVAGLVGVSEKPFDVEEFKGRMLRSEGRSP